MFGDLLRPIIQLGVAVILFEGGLNLRFHELKSAGSVVRRLVLLGIPLSWALGTLAAFYVSYLSLPVGLVFGAIIVASLVVSVRCAVAIVVEVQGCRNQNPTQPEE